MATLNQMIDQSPSPADPPETVQSRTSAADGHILISGTGRAGTTVLVQYFTALGFDTGFTLDQAVRKVDPISTAGLEHQLDQVIPYVSKSPLYTDTLGAHLDDGSLRVKCCLVPMRDLYSAAESRRRVHRDAAAAGMDASSHRGTLWKTTDPSEQEEKLAVQFYQLIYELARRRIPLLLLIFPTLVRSAAELFERLHPLLAAHGVTRAESDAAWARVVDPALVHDFGDG